MKKRNFLSMLAGFAMGVGMLSGQVPLPAGASAPVPTIGINDSLTIDALGVEEISKEWHVNASGKVSLPLVGYMTAAGLTQEQFEADLTARLSKYVKEPQVSVFISESRSRPVVIAGAVQSPGQIQVDGRATLLAVLAQVGGPKDAGPSVTVTRPVERGTIPYPGAAIDDEGEFASVVIPLVEVLDGSTRAANLRIQPFDRVTVSTVKPEVPKIYIAGDVAKPGMIELVQLKSLSIALLYAQAGGKTPTSKLSDTIVVHVNEKGERTTTETVDLDKVIKGTAEDFQLVAGDIVVVPSSKMAQLLNQLPQSLVSNGMFMLGRF